MLTALPVIAFNLTNHATATVWYQAGLCCSLPGISLHMQRVLKISTSSKANIANSNSTKLISTTTIHTAFVLACEHDEQYQLALIKVSNWRQWGREQDAWQMLIQLLSSTDLLIATYLDHL
jgi:hypothetical protein